MYSNIVSHQTHIINKIGENNFDFFATFFEKYRKMQGFSIIFSVFSLVSITYKKQEAEYPEQSALAAFPFLFL